MRISDWSSDVCSSDLAATLRLSASSLRKINNRSPARPSPDGYVDFVGTDIGGIEDAAIPFHRGRALGMARLGHGIEELLKSRSATNLFVWSTTFAIDEPPVIDAENCEYYLFDPEAMAPVVPKS